MMHLLHNWRTGLATIPKKWAANILSVKILGVTTLALSFALFSAPTAFAQDNSQWVHSFVSSQDVEMTSMDLSDIGEVFIAGTFHGTIDFDPSPAENSLVSGPSDTSFIAKYDPAGNLVWAYRLVGGGDVRINDIVVDSTAQIGVVGSFEDSADLDPGAGVFQATSKGGHDIFVLRLLPDGNLQWAWTGGDTEDDMGFGITTDARSALYITGKFEGKIFFQSGNSLTYEHRSLGGSDVFAALFNNAGHLFWVRSFGGEEDDAGSDIGLDGASNVFITGTFAGEADLDPLHNVTSARSRGRDDIFVSMVTVAGESRWQTYMGSAGSESNPQILVKPDGSFYLTGLFERTGYFNLSETNGTIDSRGGQDIFLAHYGVAPARSFQWVRGIGGEHNETLGGIAQDGFGNLYILGTYGGTVDFDPQAGVTEMTSSGAADIFLGKYSSQGELRRVQGMINPQNDFAGAIAIKSSNNVLIGGQYSGTIDLGSDLVASTGQADGVYSLFIAQYTRDTWTPLPLRAFLPGIIASPSSE